jgi:polysaccharide biosynthesis protein PslH
VEEATRYGDPSGRTQDTQVHNSLATVTMRILILAHRIPYPPNKGDKIRSYNILKHLGRRHEIHLATLIEDAGDREYLSVLSSIVTSLVYDKIDPWARNISSAISLLKTGPISVSYFFSQKMQKAINRLLGQYKFDAIICSSSPMAEYILRSGPSMEKVGNPLLLMDLMDVDSCKWRQYAEKCSGIKRWLYNREAILLSDYEKKIVREFDHVFLVSEQEKYLLSEDFSASNVSAMSNGVDMKYFRPMGTGKISKSGHVLVFTGAMDYWPNVEGVEWFARKVFPKIKEAFPDVTFYIAGSRPTQAVQRLGRLDGVRVTGYVNDIRDYLSMADVCVVPLRIARGIQNKVLEAFAMGKAVVCTPQALEGIRATPGKEVLVAENPEDFVECVTRLLNDLSTSQNLGRDARKCVEANYSWGKNLKILDEILGQ